MQLVSLILIHWIVTYPMDSAIQRLNNLVQVNNAMHWMNLYPLDSTIGFPNTYPLDSDLSDG